MNKLEDIIRSNREAFDHDEPMPGHDSRFRKKLSEQTRWYAHRSLIVAIAAGLLLLISLSLWFTAGSRSMKLPHQTTLASILPEYKEVEQYYMTSLNEKIAELNDIPCVPHWKKHALLLEMKMLEKDDIQLLSELKGNPGNVLLVQAILQQYQIKLDILNDLLNRLQPICEHVNTNPYEKDEFSL